MPEPNPFNPQEKQENVEVEFKGRDVIFNKLLNRLDAFVLTFVALLREAKVNYVIVSGYVPILFGRSRNTEDVDVLIEPLDEKRFAELWAKLKDSVCLNVESMEDAYEHISRGTAIRFAKKGGFIPNMEVKFISNPAAQFALDNRLHVHLNDNTLDISPLELQIAYKLFLGSEKDIEDARFLFKLFEDKLDANTLDEFMQQFDIPEDKKKLLGGLK